MGDTTTLSQRVEVWDQTWQWLARNPEKIGFENGELMKE
jgi:hypothetical protein